MGRGNFHQVYPALIQKGDNWVWIINNIQYHELNLDKMFFQKKGNYMKKFQVLGQLFLSHANLRSCTEKMMKRDEKLIEIKVPIFFGKFMIF